MLRKYSIKCLSFYFSSYFDFRSHRSVGCLVWEMNGLRRPWCWLKRTDIKCLSQISHPISLPIPKCWPVSLGEVIKQATRLDANARPSFQDLYGEVFKPMMDAERNNNANETSGEDTKTTQVRFTGNRNKASQTLATSSSSGTPRRSCLRATSHSVALMQRALPSMVKIHRISQCMCKDHNNDTKPKEPKAPVKGSDFTDHEPQNHYNHHCKASKEEIIMNIQTVESKVVDFDVVGRIDDTMMKNKPIGTTSTNNIRKVYCLRSLVGVSACFIFYNTAI